MQDFSVEGGGPQNVLGGPIFRRRNEILVLGRAIKFGVIFQKYALKLKELKNY